MISYHGWLSLHSSDEDDDVSALYQNVKNRIESEDITNCSIDAKCFNGECHAWLSGCFNHKTGRHEQVMSVLNDMIECAPGSYGLVYVKDDEDEKCNNEFQVLVIKKGKMHWQKDEFLSPCIPSIEDSLE